MKNPDLAHAVQQLPHLPGVYRYFDAENRILYVGKARDLKKRVSSYFRKNIPHPRIAKMVEKIARLETTVTPTEVDALILENNLIKALQPRYNIVFRDDKSYPYLQITGHDFPRLVYYRGRTQKNHQYFGPFPHADAVKSSIQTLQKIFLLRTCEDSVFAHRSRPCLLHQIQRCSAPCVGLIDAASYGAQVSAATEFLRGASTTLLEKWQEQMQEFSQALAFEKAAEMRNRIILLSRVLQQQNMEVANAATPDLDIIAVVVEGTAACINIAMVRGGRHLGDRAYFPRQFPDIHDCHPEAAVLGSFLLQYAQNTPLPARLLLNIRLPAQDAKTLKAALEIQCKHSISLITRAREKERQWRAMAEQAAYLALAQHSTTQQQQATRVQALITELGLDARDITTQKLSIECFDISHTAGEATQAACVVFQNHAMQVHAYRRYHIKNIALGDDYAAMEQVLLRRYQKESPATLPSIVLIDGGRGHVEVARRVFVALGLPLEQLLGIAKGENRQVGLESLIFADTRPPRLLGKQSAALMLLAQIRDEAHRFAITGMRTARARKRQTSRLEEIAGIGTQRRQKLLARFGSLQGIADASMEDLSSVAGISATMAAAIYAQFHGTA